MSRFLTVTLCLTLVLGATASHGEWKDPAPGDTTPGVNQKVDVLEFFGNPHGMEQIEINPNPRNATIGGDTTDDIILGDDTHNTLAGLGGQDFLVGYAGSDVLEGGAEADIILGGDGNDVLNGNGGDDYIVGGNGNDTMTGGPGDDTFFVDEYDKVDGGDGYDTILACKGWEIVDLSQVKMVENMISLPLTDARCSQLASTEAEVDVEVSGDPHFTGFDNGRFDYNGAPGKMFTVLSSADTLVNALLGWDLIEGLTYMTTVGVKSADQTLKVTAVEGAHQLLVEVNGVPLDLTNDASPMKLNNGVRVAWTETNAVQLVTPTVALTIAKRHDQFLDINEVILRREDPTMHGVLGQTAIAGRALSSGFEGAESDYYVSDLFLDDSAFGGVYKGTTGVASRRMGMFQPRQASVTQMEA